MSLTLFVFMLAPAALAAQDDARINELISEMTLEEKVSLVHADSKFTVAGIPRLGIPNLTMSDGPHGVREDLQHDSWENKGSSEDFSTALPVNLCLAATFDPEMAEAYGTVIGQEAKRRGKNIMLGPSLNIQRTPLCGRNFEYMGEDPYLTGRIAVGYIHGEQAQGVSSCAKHFACNNQETQRNTINVELDERALREIYLPAFKAAVQEGGVHCIMGAYNEIRGQHCCHNEYLLNTILKGQWGFTGMVMTDWGGAHDTLQAASNGLDLEMGTRGPYNKYYLADPYLALLRAGKVSVSDLDDKVRRHLRVMMALGLLGKDSADANADGGATTGGSTTGGSINTPAHQATARKVAEEGIVLLKNDGGLLPLDATKVGSIAVIGENAVRDLCHAGGSAEIKAFYEITPLQGILKRCGGKANVTFSIGYGEKRRDEDLIPRAVKAASEANVAIVVAGLPHDRFYDSEGSDRKDLKLPFGQDELIRQVVAANPRTIVVLVDGGAVEMPWVNDVPAIMQAWYPGMEGGNAVAEAIFGDINPSGKLPCTFPKQLSDSPAHALGAFPGADGVVEYKEGILVGYRWFDAKNIEPLFPFGFGLSYTKFGFGNLHITPQHGANEQEATVECDVTNRGDRAGYEVAEVYVGQAHPSLPRPPKELKGFKRIWLEPGQSGHVSIPLSFSSFAYYDPARGGWVADKDDFTISVGNSSRDLRLTGTWSRTESDFEKE